MNNIFTPPQFFRKYRVNIFVGVLILVSSCSNFPTLNKENSPESQDNNPTLTTPFLSNLRSVPLWFEAKPIKINKDGNISYDDALLVYVSEKSHTEGLYNVFNSKENQKEKLEMTIQPDKVLVRSIVTSTKDDGTPNVSTNDGCLTRSHTKPNPLPKAEKP